jgi:putative glutamine amidotransferase
VNIKLAYDFWFDAYQSLFPEIELFDWNKHAGDKIDLMVFPGGEDVSLEYYSSRDEIENYKNLCYSDKERDLWEFNILDGCYDKRLNVNKILGVCRGLQLLNVAFDGNLYQDLGSLGVSHDRVHVIQHKVISNLAFMETVNSMHHQGIRSLGKFTRVGNKNYPTIIATNGNIPEIVTWENDRVLGVQFHPEIFMDGNTEKEMFRDFCYDWMSDKITILKEK